MQKRLRRTRGVQPAEKSETHGVEETEAEDSVEVGAVGSMTQREKQALDRIEQKYRDRATSPLRAIRAFCVLCMGCQPRMVVACTATNCVLYPFRFGKNPYQKHTEKPTKLKSIANEADDESTGPTDEGVKPAVRAKRQGRTRS